MGRKILLHVAQDAIRRQDGSPAIIVRDYKGAVRAHEVELVLPDGIDALVKQKVAERLAAISAAI